MAISLVRKKIGLVLSHTKNKCSRLFLKNPKFRNFSSSAKMCGRWRTVHTHPFYDIKKTVTVFIHKKFRRCHLQNSRIAFCIFYGMLLITPENVFISIWIKCINKEPKNLQVLRTICTFFTNFHKLCYYYYYWKISC